MSCAVYVTDSTVEPLTVKEAWPAAFVVPATVVIVEPPSPCVSDTSLPATGCPEASISVTVIVEVELPSATTLAAFAATVDADALTGPTPKLTPAVCVSVVPSVVSVAV